VRGLGVREVYSIDPFDEENALQAMKQAAAATGVSVIICNSPCVVHEKRLGLYERQPPYAIDPEACTRCSLCVRTLGCPAIQVADERYSIDADLCEGCGLCARVCRQDAIKR
jgi:indolepyruvate ferredoxin oxidoreductase alpha subunit